MSATILVETADFVDAANNTYHSVADPLLQSWLGLSSALDGCAGMAGDDPNGREWARSYDVAAAAGIAAGRDAVNANYNLAALFEQSALNYAVADAASAPGTRAAISDHIALLPGIAEAPSAVPPPTATGSGSGSPAGWSFIEGLIGHVWPNGHQDRLRAAAGAWERAARVAADCADFSWLGSIRFIVDRLPEADDMISVCSGMTEHLRRLAAVYRLLAGSCRQMADHLDAVHSAVLDELSDLAWQTGAIEGVGGLASIFSLGMAEAPTQAVEASRVAAIAARVGRLIEGFGVAARAVAARIGAVAESAQAIGAELRAIAELRAAAASVTVARRFPAVGRIGEQVAAARLALGYRGGILVGIEDPKRFDPMLLEGMTMSRVRASIPKTWARKPTKTGDGEVFIDPIHRGRRIRIMPGYKGGSRPEQLTWGPYVVVSQTGVDRLKLPLAGNHLLR